ncbi:tetratricopeptide repeat protein [Leptolyngbya sp. FACHB-261]|uniref:tetratricopeptide repeat protein n=1 Tax=Leptolyngbya sp. FACHB-261 TaxID=2692806 RepID=UPI0016845017|nr:tetratricopeptide repeat protein [Leptolyngbya sp. FACHB-261]MBD2103009.1 tetratricopeptide repeat protein [Leptolyngbya sp. FACHB-261]
MNFFEVQKAAQTCFMQANYPDAISLYEQCIAIDEVVISSYWYLGLSFLLQNQELEAETVWFSAIAQAQADQIDALTEDLSHVLKAEIARQVQADSLASAQKIIDKIVEFNPEDFETQWYLGNLFLAQREFLPAIEHFQKCLELKSDSPEAYFNLGYCFKELGDLDKAISAFKTVIELKPELAEAYLNLGYTLRDRGNLDSAIATLEQAIAIKPDFAEAYYSLGLVHRGLSKLDQAAASLEQAIAIRPSFIEAHYHLGFICRDKGDLDTAITHFEKAIEFQPELPELHCNLGLVLRERGHFGRAILSLEKAIALNPELPEAHCNLGFTFRDINDPSQSILSLRRAIELRPNFPEAHCVLGLSLRDQGALDKAIHYLQHAITLQPNLQEAVCGLREIISAQKAGYSLKLEQGYGVWDPWLLKDGDVYRLFYLTANRQVFPFWSVGEIGSAVSTDLETWQYLGTALEPNSEFPWQSGRMLAGSAYKEDGTYYLFYSAAPPRPDTLREGIGLAVSTDAIHWHRSSDQLIMPDSRFYISTWHPLIREGMHTPWRDPYVIQDPNTGKYYLFMSAAGRGDSKFNGCIGLAVADKIDGPYEVLPPAAYPVIDQLGEGIYYEMERPQVIYNHGLYYLFFSVGPTFINPKWIDKVGIDQITGSSLHCYVSEQITGPFQPIAPKPIVKGSDKTGLYGTNFIQGPDGEFFAYGCYFKSFTLEVSPRFPVRWQPDSIEILVS